MNRRSASRIIPLAVASLSGAAFFIPLTAPATAATDNGSLSAKVASGIVRISREKLPAVVRVRCQDSHGEINGTGFYLDPTGTVCTLAEIVRDGSNITVQQGERELPATLLAIDARSGTALLKTRATNDGVVFLTPVPRDTPSPRTPVVGIGYTRADQAQTVLGMITGSESHEGERFFCLPHLMASMPLREGEGGSPVMDLSGNLLGMVAAGNPQSDTCAILPAAAIQKLHGDTIRYGAPNPGWLGVVVEEAAVPVHHSRTRVSSVIPGSPAEAAGVRRGDTVLSLDSRTIRDPEEVLEASFFLTAGDPVRMQIVRGGETRTLTLRSTTPPGVTPPSPGNAGELSSLGTPQR